MLFICQGELLVVIVMKFLICFLPFIFYFYNTTFASCVIIHLHCTKFVFFKEDFMLDYVCYYEDLFTVSVRYSNGILIGKIGVFLDGTPRERDLEAVSKILHGYKDLSLMENLRRQISKAYTLRVCYNPPYSSN